MTRFRVACPWLILSSFLFFASCELWGPWDNPVDSDGENYQGYETVSDVNAVKPMESDYGATTYIPTLVSSAVLGASAYQFQISDSADFSSILHTSDEIAGNQFLANDCPGLNSATPYYWRVRAKKDGVWGEYSTEIATFILNAPVFGVITPTNGATTNDTTPLLDWSDVTGSSGYEIQYADTIEGLPASSAFWASESNYQISNGLVLGTWYWRVRTRNSDNVWGAWSDSWSFTVAWPYTIIPSPSNGGVTSDTTPLLDWNYVAEAVGYEIQYAGTSDGVVGSTAIATASSQYQYPSIFALGETLYWRVRAKNADDVWGAWSNIWSFTVVWTYSLACSPSNGGTTSDTTPLLDWSDVNSASGYEVQYADTSAGVVSAMAVEASSSQYQYPMTLTLGDVIYWRVRAKNADNVWGSWTSTWSFSIRAHAVGDTGPAGGMVFYDKGSYSDGWRYLESRTTDEDGLFHQWKTTPTSTTGTSTAIGTGYTNTYTAMAGTSHPAAELARLAIYGGYNDWFLPSKDELNQMYLQRSIIGGFGGYPSGYYWSSSEFDNDDAWTQQFYYGHQGFSIKSTGYRVRVIRAF